MLMDTTGVKPFLVIEVPYKRTRYIGAPNMDVLTCGVISEPEYLKDCKTGKIKRVRVRFYYPKGGTEAAQV